MHFVAHTLKSLTSLVPLFILANCASVSKPDASSSSANAPAPRDGLSASSAALYTQQEDGKWQQTRLDLEAPTPALQDGAFVLTAKANTSVWGYNPYTGNYDKQISRSGTQATPTARRSAKLSFEGAEDSMKMVPAGHGASWPNQDVISVALQISPDPETSAAAELPDGSPITVKAVATVGQRTMSVSKGWTLKVEPEQDPKLVEGL